MSGFNRRVWRAKPPMGTPLVNGLFAPDRMAVPFNEISLNPGFRDYAIAPSAPVLGVDSSSSGSAIVQGRNGPMLSLTNVSTRIAFTAGCARLPTTQATFMLGYNKRDSTARAANAFGNDTGGGAGRANAYIPFSDGVVYWDWNGTGGSNRLSIGSLSFGGYDVWAFTTGPRGMEIWRNGQLITSNANNATRSQVATNDFYFGSDNANGSDQADFDFFYCWSTQLTPALIQQLSILPFSVFEPHRVKIFPSASGPQTIDPDSILSAESWGSPFVHGGNQSITLDSIPSVESWGSPVVAGPIEPGTIASAEDWGTPELKVSQQLLLLTIGSSESWGSPRVAFITITSPGTIASAESWGTPEIVGGKKGILLGSIPSGESWGTPFVTGGERQLQIFVGGIDRRRWVQFAGSEIRSQTLGRWTGTLLFLNTPGGDESLIDTEDEWIPSLGQVVQVREFDNKLLTGCISEVDVDRFAGTNCLAYTCQIADKGSICDHRIVTVQKYTADQDVADIYRDIITNYLDGEGISASLIPSSLGPLGSLLQIYYWSVTQVFDSISNLTGLQWFIDVDSFFRAVDPTVAPAAPFNLTEDSQNYRNLQVQTKLDAYRNRQYVISNRNTVDNGITEHWTVPSDWFRDFLGAPDASAPDNRGSGKLKYNVLRMISIKLNGVLQDFASLIDPVDWSTKWLYLQGSPYVYSPNDPSTFPLDGDIVEVRYVPDGGASGVDENAPLAVTPPPDPTPGEQFGTCGSGIYEAVEQYDNITDVGDLQALATALLNRSGIVPITVQYETDFPGLRVGMKQNGNIPRHLLNNVDLFITEIDGRSEGIDYGHESTWRWQVTATNLVDDTNWKKWFERLVRRTQTPAPIPIPLPITFVLGPGQSLAAGVSVTNPVLVAQSGRVDEVAVVAGDPPSGQSLVIDLKANGVSILGPGKLVVPAGHTAAIIDTVFAFSIQYLFKNDVITCDVSYSATGGTIIPAKNVTVTIRQIV